MIRGLDIFRERFWAYEGSLVLMSDAFLASNEALWKDRQPELLRWLAGGSARLVFDETHLGVNEQPGIATLLRRYQLYWVVAAALAVFGLAIWRNASPLVPATSGCAARYTWVAAPASSGFMNTQPKSRAVSTWYQGR